MMIDTRGLQLLLGYHLSIFHRAIPARAPAAPSIHAEALRELAAALLDVAGAEVEPDVPAPEVVGAVVDGAVWVDEAVPVDGVPEGTALPVDTPLVVEPEPEGAEPVLESEGVGSENDGEERTGVLIVVIMDLGYDSGFR
jgi:hypothetical protein